jgi:hypothetical protein
MEKEKDENTFEFPFHIYTTLVKGIFRQNNDKNIKMILCTQITLKWHFLKFQHEFLFKFYTFWVLSVNISIYVEQNLHANRITE